MRAGRTSRRGWSENVGLHGASQVDTGSGQRARSRALRPDGQATPTRPLTRRLGLDLAPDKPDEAIFDRYSDLETGSCEHLRSRLPTLTGSAWLCAGRLSFLHTAARQFRTCTGFPFHPPVRRNRRNRLATIYCVLIFWSILKTGLSCTCPREGGSLVCWRAYTGYLPDRKRENPEKPLKEKPAARKNKVLGSLTCFRRGCFFTACRFIEPGRIPFSLEQVEVRCIGIMLTFEAIICSLVPIF